METNLVCELKKQTGASEELCYTLLEGQGWDITSALVAYMQLAGLICIFRDAFYIVQMNKRSSMLKL